MPDVFLHLVHSPILRVRAALAASGGAMLGPARPPSGAGPSHSHGGAHRAGERQVPALRQRRSRQAGPCGAGRSRAGSARVPGRSGARAPLTLLPFSQHPQGRVAAQRRGPGPVSAAPLPPSPEAASEGWQGVGAGWESCRSGLGGVGAGTRRCWKGAGPGPAGAWAVRLRRLNTAPSLTSSAPA